MKHMEFKFITSLVRDEIHTAGSAVSNDRIKKYLWIEVILNPLLAGELKSSLHSEPIRQCMIDALSWYRAFRWLFPENKQLEELYKSHLIEPYSISMGIYRQMRSSFLKGIIHAGLC